VAAFREFGEDEMDVRMDGRVAAITGASTGLGLAMAKEFAASGASVALLARKADVLAKAKADVATAAGKTNAKIEAYSCDVSKAQPIADTFKKIEADFGKVDILVNNAGISHAKPFETVTDEDWQGDLDLKLFAAIRTIRAVLPGMRQRKWGRIVNVLNIGAKAPNANSTPTSVSRAAGLALTKALSQENAQHGVLVNAMLVGLIESDQWVRRHKTAAGEGKTYEEFLAGMAKGRIPLGRMGKAEEFARMACFLCSDAGSFITGVAINVDGGASPVV
jgi:3-oxoacyl-[acyl-carrier protein] reductase